MRHSLLLFLFCAGLAFGACTGRDSADWEGLRKEANELYGEQRYEEAVDVYERALAVATGDNRLTLRQDIIDCYQGQGRQDEVRRPLFDGYENYTTTCTAAQWTALEAKGCVFLPAAGNRTGTTVSDAGNAGAYWTATGSDSKASDIYPYSYRVYFGQTSWGNPQYYSQQQKTYGHSVRLVRAVE